MCNTDLFVKRITCRMIICRANILSLGKKGFFFIITRKSIPKYLNHFQIYALTYILNKQTNGRTLIPNRRKSHNIHFQFSKIENHFFLKNKPQQLINSSSIFNCLKQADIKRIINSAADVISFSSPSFYG